MAKTEQLDREQIINAIWRAKGKVALAARMLDTSTRTLFNYASKYATIQQAIDDARLDFDEQLLDLAETSLFDCVKNKQPWAVKYTLQSKGQARGYVQRQELTGKDGGNIKLDVEVSDAKDRLKDMVRRRNEDA